MPHVVFAFNVLLEADRLVVESRTIKTADEASVFQDELFLLFLRSEVGKCVNNHTEN